MQSWGSPNKDWPSSLLKVLAQPFSKGKNSSLVDSD